MKLKYDIGLSSNISSVDIKGILNNWTDTKYLLFSNSYEDAHIRDRDFMEQIFSLIWLEDAHMHPVLITDKGFNLNKLNHPLTQELVCFEFDYVTIAYPKSASYQHLLSLYDIALTNVHELFIICCFDACTSWESSLREPAVSRTILQARDIHEFFHLPFKPERKFDYINVCAKALSFVDITFGGYKYFILAREKSFGPLPEFVNSAGF